MQTSLAETLRVLRARHDLSVTEAARRIGISRETLRNLEHGRRAPWYPTLEKIARAYGVTVEELMLPAREESAPEPEIAAPLGEAPDAADVAELEEMLPLYRQFLDMVYEQVLAQARAYEEEGDLGALQTLTARVGLESYRMAQLLNEEGITALYETDKEARRVYFALVRLDELGDSIDEIVDRLTAEGAEVPEGVTSIADHVRRKVG